MQSLSCDDKQRPTSVVQWVKFTNNNQYQTYYMHFFFVCHFPSYTVIVGSFTQEHKLTQQTNQLLALKRENDSLNKRLRHMER